MASAGYNNVFGLFINFSDVPVRLRQVDRCRGKYTHNNQTLHFCNILSS